MTEQDILRLRDLAEAGQVQFKERIVSKDDKYDIGSEMVAFSNSRGGKLIIGINDKSGQINALTDQLKSLFGQLQSDKIKWILETRYIISGKCVLRYFSRSTR